MASTDNVGVVGYDVFRDGAFLELEELRSWAGELLSTYKVPKRLAVVDDFPRNAMGKVMKPSVRGFFEEGSTA
mgnify:CR=1 FL=1